MGNQDEDLEGLSDEERAALEDDDDESEIIAKIAGGDDEEEADASDSTVAGIADGTGVDSTGGGAAADADADVAESGESPVVTAAPEFQPQFKAEPPEGLTEKLAGLDTRTDELMAKFKEGEMEMADFLKETRAIDAERLHLTLATEQAKWAQSQNEASREQRWTWEQERFFAQNGADIYKDQIVLAALNASVKQLAADSKHASKPGSFFLEEADRQVRARFGGGQAQQPVNKPKSNTPDLSKVPKTLANLPAAEVSETGADEFAYLDKLDGIALEQALRKMTPEQEARYLGAAS